MAKLSSLTRSRYEYRATLSCGHNKIGYAVGDGPPYPEGSTTHCWECGVLSRVLSREVVIRAGNKTKPSDNDRGLSY
jgi:hypothetical protein